MKRTEGDLLPYITSPEDIKMLDLSNLQRLAGEIRRHIISSVSRTGGHLAPNLGTVELTLGIHHVFDSPRDRIIWDVGHQAYTHKIVTGRLERFDTLRQGGGLSGYPCRDESPHDAFGTGHSSTSVAAALGFATAARLRGEDRDTVAVIGDGALTGGLAYEGLNNAGDMGVDLKVVLNDNSMSIAPNVGAMSRYLSRLRSEPTYQRLKDDVTDVLNSIPRVGRPVTDSIRRIKGGLKYLLIPGIIFEELGFTYLGPVDGHDLGALIDILEKARRIDGPVLVHAITVKGRGYEPAENKPDKFHGVGAFDVHSGSSGGSASVKYTDVFADTLVQLAEEDERIVAVTAAMPDGTGLGRFAERHPDRFFDVGIAEQAAVTFAAGLAASGLRPVAAIYSTFLQRAYDQVMHDAAMQRLPVVFALDRAGIVGGDGETHQGAFDIAYLRHIPNMVVMAPRDEDQLRHMMATACSHEDGPVAVRYPRGSGWGVTLAGDPGVLPIGRGELLRTGDDAAIIALGHPVHEALRAHEILGGQGIGAAVLDAKFVKPLDREMIVKLAESVPVLVTVEDGVLCGGFGSAVLEALTADIRPAEMPVVARIGLPDEFIPHGDQGAQRRQYGLVGEEIASRVSGLVRRAGRPR